MWLCLLCSQALVRQYTDLSDIEYERYFNYALIWSLGGTLEVEARDPFSTWWRETFEKYLDLPQEATVSLI